MKTKQVIAPLLSLSVSLFLSSCGDDHHGGGHHHKAPHGGVLVELGEHGTGFNLEVVHNAETGDLGIYVFDGHASNPVRIKQESIDLTVTVGDEKKEVSLAAVANPAFDITPNKLVSAIITEKGVVKAPYQESIAALFEP